jgi:hypothetical protein
MIDFYVPAHLTYNLDPDNSTPSAEDLTDAS